MALIPAAVPECHVLTVQSSSSDFWPKGIALSSLPLAFCFVHAKKKTDNTTIKSNSKKS
jgi:hypothetical protein